MKLRTSYFNTTAYQKNLTRFAPAWALYTIAGLLITVTFRADNGADYYYASNIGDSLRVMSVVNLCYALLVAQLLFGDLYNSRMCNALHALPMRREGWFMTNVLSGLTYAAAPNAVVALFMSLLMGEFWYVAFVWLLIATLQYLFFFGVAVFSAYCVGNRFAMALVYGLVNFLSMLAFWLVYTFYAPALYGIDIMEESFVLFCPVAQMVDTEYVRLLSDGLRNTVLTICWGNFLYPAICAVIGVGFMGLGLLIYRRRALESAGDFVTVKPLVPVFLVLYTLCAGAFLYLFDEVFAGGAELLFMFIGFVCGYITGKMLLGRTLRVFNRRTFAGLGIFVLAFALSMLLVRIDPFGVTRWVPNAQSVKQVQLANYNSSYDGHDILTLTDPADIENILKVHQHGVDNRHEGNDGIQDVRIALRYTLKSGRVVQRSYYINTNTEEGKILREMMSRPEYVLGDIVYDLDDFARNCAYFEVSGTGHKRFTPEEIKSLMQAIILDCEAGNMAQRNGFQADYDYACWIDYEQENREGRILYRSITIYTSCENTIAWLMENGCLDKEVQDLIIYEKFPDITGPWVEEMLPGLNESIPITE